MSTANTVMATSAYVRTMARYNAGMNRRLYEAAGRLGDGERRKSRGAFWDSIHGTFNHLLWGDQLWMSRFDTSHWEKPATVQKDSASMITDFATLDEARKQADEKILAWAGGVSDDWLAGDLSWFSGATGRDMKMPAGFLVVHFFNHQTHHRGQAHALITAAGEKTGDTDLFLVSPVTLRPRQ
jgi:uncharacterized damage-inducible protein DinB